MVPRRMKPQKRGLLDLCQLLGRVALMSYVFMSMATILYLTSQRTSSMVVETVHTTQGTISTKSSQVRGAQVSVLPVMPPKTSFAPPKGNPYFDQMAAMNTTRSMDHHKKFMARKDDVAINFESKVRFQSKLDDFAAIVVSETFAFLHIWKCGGTTIAAMMDDRQVRLSDSAVQSREWIAFVRDPIDRFLSAWAECGFRQFEGTIEFEGLEHHSVLRWIDGEYDFRLRAFLNEVKDFTFPKPWMSCHTHAHPQANAMTDESGKIDSHMSIVGDLSELKQVIQIADFFNYNEQVKGRDASSNQIKAQHFPSRRDLIKDQTLLELCDFYAMDYFLFDFEPPTVCVQAGGPLAHFY